MPKKPVKQDDPPAFQFQGYVYCPMSKAEAADYQGWAGSLTPSDVIDKMVELVEAGYKFTAGNNKLGWTATLANVEAEGASRGWMLSATARDIYRAITLLLYKHYVKLDGGWPTSDEDGGFDLK